MFTTEELVMQIQYHNDDECFKQLEQKLKPLMISVYYQHYYHCIELEDFIQEASLLLYFTVKKFDINKGTSFFAYYYRSLKNYAIQLIRQEHRESNIPERYICKEEISNFRDEFSFEDEFLIREELGEYWNSLSSYEKAVMVFYVKGYSFSEIAEKANKSKSSIMSAFQRCHKKFNIFYDKIHRKNKNI